MKRILLAAAAIIGLYALYSIRAILVRVLIAVFITTSTLNQLGRDPAVIGGARQQAREPGHLVLVVAPAIGRERSIALANVDDVAARGGMDAREIPQGRSRLGAERIGGIAADVREGGAVAAGSLHRLASADVDVEPAQPPLREIEPGHMVACFNPVPVEEWQRARAAAVG